MFRIFKHLLWPVSIIYSLAIFIWTIYWKFAAQTKFPCKIISVGNIVAGGTGKTPLVIYIAKLAVAANLKTAVVARGYKRSGKGLLKVNQNSEWQTVGDEPLEVCRRVPDARVYVCESKTIAAQKASADGAQLILIDDGFQHRRLARNLDIVCLDYHHPFDNGHLLPSGQMREHPNALSRADCVVFTASDKPPKIQSLSPLKNSAPAFFSRVKLVNLINFKTSEIMGAEKASGLKSLAFCGLGSPRKFENSLAQIAIIPERFISFDDHHVYTKADIERLTASAKDSGIDILITTHKDAVKLEHFDFGGLAVYYCLVELEIDNEAAFRKMLGL
jgi:tetraacyldisaccharide 4'-kinase